MSSQIQFCIIWRFFFSFDYVFNRLIFNTKYFWFIKQNILLTWQLSRLQAKQVVSGPRLTSSPSNFICQDAPLLSEYFNLYSHNMKYQLCRLNYGLYWRLSKVKSHSPRPRTAAGSANTGSWFLVVWGLTLVR